MKLRPIRSHVIVEAKPRKGNKIAKGSKVIPPSDYFIVDGGNSELKKGQEVVFGGAARMTPIRGELKKYVVHSEAVIAFYE